MYPNYLAIGAAKHQKDELELRQTIHPEITYKLCQHLLMHKVFNGTKFHNLENFTAYREHQLLPLQYIRSYYSVIYNLVVLMCELLTILTKHVQHGTNQCCLVHGIRTFYRR